MFSQLFRRETSRRLRLAADEIVEAYLQVRLPCISRYHTFSPALARSTIDMLAEAIAREDVTWYRDYASEQLRDLMAAGTPPVILLAAGDMLYETVLQFVTPDQRLLVEEILVAVREQRQAIVYEQVIAQAEEKGA